MIRSYRESDRADCFDRLGFRQLSTGGGVTTLGISTPTDSGRS
ncbi:MAG: hypothetical protein ABUT11_04065 [Leifsonia sp.]